MLKDMKYVIVDPRLTGCDAALARYVQSQDAEPVGYAFLSPMEGPIFTTILSAATKFDTLEQAEKVLADKYGDDRRLKILPAIYPGDKTAQGWEQWLVVEETCN